MNRGPSLVLAVLALAAAVVLHGWLTRTARYTFDRGDLVTRYDPIDGRGVRLLADR